MNRFVLKKTHARRETTSWIGRHVPILASTASKMIQETFFRCNTNSHHRVSSFITALEGSATQSKAEMKMKTFEVGTAIIIRLLKMLEQLNQRHNRAETVMDFVDDCMVESEEQHLSTHCLQVQKNQLIFSQDHFERSCKVLPFFGFSSANFDLNLIKSFLLPILVNERDIESNVIKKANQFVPFKFCDIQLLDNIHFFGGATSLDVFA